MFGSFLMQRLSVLFECSETLARDFFRRDAEGSRQFTFVSVARDRSGAVPPPSTHGCCSDSSADFLLSVACLPCVHARVGDNLWSLSIYQFVYIFVLWFVRCSHLDPFFCRIIGSRTVWTSIFWNHNTCIIWLVELNVKLKTMARAVVR